ncbi:S-methyl-5'-thioadenosine phosphorylase [Parvularcula sp. ZS-1/3]|uniref:S-methyl-5'-thioadenosine phosphorylase n=1 Tax=Parvularcula mediterranea TaxID=2732508 RepID=A0A7Y3RME3_9PROT|nr:S-methyl-5'-thioadenosine phosphorylase [Parvularcula mediterranea]NNU16275.1 S-methyl-5'-thioadenosine phosphorylase [Parvularcula mediterranea]
MTDTRETCLAIFGGSGIYEMPGLTIEDERDVETPWGKPSAPVTVGRLNGVRVLFLSRHGKGHSIPPSDLNARANVAAAKMLGATDMLSLSACGSFREELAPGHFVAVDQFVDRTKGRTPSFFETGCVAHVSIAHPVCSRLSEEAAQAAEAAGAKVHRGGTYLVMEGPQFSTKAESELYRSWGMDVIGMTAMPEAKLAREAELPYAILAMVTDYDCWHEDNGAVDVASVLAILGQNRDKGHKTVGEITKMIGTERTPSPDGIDTCLDYAIVTAPEARDPKAVEKLKAIAGRVL